MHKNYLYWNIGIFSLVILFCVCSGTRAEDNQKSETPPWMEDVTVKGRSTYLVPKGAKREIIGSQVIVEPPNEYVARRLYEIEQDIQNRFEQILNEQEKIRTELERLKKEMETTPAKEVEGEKSE